MKLKYSVSESSVDIIDDQYSFLKEVFVLFQNFGAQASWSHVHGTADQNYADKILELFTNNTASL